MSFLHIFKRPKPVNITGRTSSITNSFVNGIIPFVQPTENEIKKCVEILHLNPNDLRCVYCGDKSTEWDHLRPIVKDKKPTGFISDIYYLVPSCGKCNQSKGNNYWREWIVGNAPQSPKTRGVEDLEARIQRLDEYEKWKVVAPINFESMVGQELWVQHWDNYETLYVMMKDAQKVAKKVKK